MYLDHHLSMKISRILDMIDESALLLDENGNVVLPEGDQRVFNLPEAIRQQPTKPLVYGGITLIGTNAEQPVFVVLQGISEEIRKLAMLCAELINNLLREDLAQTNREQSLRMMLRGEVETAEFEALAVEHDIPLTGTRCVVYAYFPEQTAESALPLLQRMCDRETDIAVEVGRHAVALFRTVAEDFDLDSVIAFCQTIENAFHMETGQEVLIGISEPHEDLVEICDAFEESRTAINVGRMYHAHHNLFVYRNLLLERFLREISPEMSVSYNSRIFNRKTARLFNDEMIHTIETFFDNSLNLSETARKLYIHRNTLVYRLEKVRRAIGLDLRNFDDAVTFKMMMLLGKNANSWRIRL
ncbi:MAG: helix-turn-helix domain-containing protein [Clostridia bacterium]|nr:helix-turn-helix domain-containing protein [Clostridia bacterium]